MNADLIPGTEEMRELYIASHLRDAAAAGTLTVEEMRKIMADAVRQQLAPSGAEGSVES